MTTKDQLIHACELALALIKDTWVAEHGNNQVGDAWGALELAIERAKVGVMSYNFTIKGKRVHIDPAANYGYWERKDGSEGGGLWFDGKVLVDFDGDYDLPKAVYEELLSIGFEVES